MALADIEGHIIKANEEFRRLYHGIWGVPLGFARETFQDMLARRNVPEFSAVVQELRGGTLNWAEVEYLLDGHDGNNRWLRIIAWLISGIPGAPEGIQGPFIGIIIREETKERQHERRLREGKANAEEAVEAKGRFLANMSHEIRTPIQTIIGMTELLQDTSLDREQAEYSRQVKFSAEVLLSLINDILDYSKIEAGKMELEHTEFELAETIEQAVEMISMEAHKKDLEMIVDLPPGTDILIQGDPNKFRQIVINLVKNAVKFTRKGGVTISGRLLDLDGKEAVRVAVADTGIGVPEENRKQLFSTFFQGDPSNTRRFGGTGLGLSISRNLVELMKGVIEMVPNEGGGSVFRFTIPLERSARTKAPLALAPGTGGRVLVVDDYPDAAKVTETYLRDLGLDSVGRASSGEEALSLMRLAAREGKPYTLCFVDMVMPLMDGWRLAAEINADREINAAGLVLMVPHGMLGADAKMTLLQWFNGYINKPVRRSELLEIIATVSDELAIDLEPVSEAGAAVDTADSAGAAVAAGVADSAVAGTADSAGSGTAAVAGTAVADS
ncbi:MAG: response regulator, partial [Spirochaetaceae bacterium]|nr:response regulator [Spirochaetaceae bacterium]